MQYSSLHAVLNSPGTNSYENTLNWISYKAGQELNGFVHLLSNIHKEPKLKEIYLFSLSRTP